MTGPLLRPYPPDAYRGNAGEVSAWLRPSDTAPEIQYASGGSCEYLLTGDQSAGTFGMYRWTFGPDESGPAAHFHRSITESFYVLSGEASSTTEPPGGPATPATSSSSRWAGCTGSAGPAAPRCC